MTVVVEMSITFNDEFNHVYIRGEGTDKQDTLEAVTTVTEWVARDRECYIRVEPEVNSEKDFDTKSNAPPSLVKVFISRPSWGAPQT